MPVSFDQNCLHLTFQPYLSSASYSCKHAKLPNIVIHECGYSRKTTLLEICGPLIWVCLFMFRPFTLNSLTLIDTFSCLVGRAVTLLTAMPEVPGSFPSYGKDFEIPFAM